MVNFRAIDCATPFLLPPSVDDWLPKDHLARVVVDIIDQLDLSALTRHYRGSGCAAYHRALMLGLLLYGYATGVYSSRRIEAATHESIAFRYIAANTHPDHDSLCTFRKRFLKEIQALFVQVLGIAIDFSSREYQNLLLRYLYQHLVRCAERNVRYAVRLDHASRNDNQQEDAPHLLTCMLASDDNQDPLTASIEREATFSSSSTNSITTRLRKPEQSFRTSRHCVVHQ